MLAIALSSLTATTASASCGDYLHLLMADVPASLQTELPRGTESPQPAVPCTGPACQNAPAIPDSPTSVDVRFSFTERLAVECNWMLAQLDAGGQPVLRNGAAFLPEGYRVGLERPPRFA